MGAVKSAIERLENKGIMEKAAKEAIQISQKLINMRFKVFESELNIPVGEIQKLPVKYLLYLKKNISVQVAKNSDKVKAAIKQTVKGFANGKISDSIVNVLDKALAVVLGAHSGGYNETQDHIIVTNLLGGIYRIDYLIVEQRMEAYALQSRCTDIFGAYLIVTSIDKKDIVDDNVYRVFIERQFPHLTIREKLLLIKLSKEQPLTPEEAAEIQQLVEDKRFMEQAENKNEDLLKQSRWKILLKDEQKNVSKLLENISIQQDNLVELRMLVDQAHLKIEWLKRMIDQQTQRQLQEKEGQEGEKEPNYQSEAQQTKRLPEHLEKISQEKLNEQHENDRKLTKTEKNQGQSQRQENIGQGETVQRVVGKQQTLTNL